ncbi:MAG: EamA family transporter [Desulfuromonadaceae bacterium]|nr:EamA family transporter [Desulfuromonadaceae bacterium]
MLAVLCGISTALCWGTADFIGGSASRRAGAYGMTLGTVACGLLFLLPAAFIMQEAPLSWHGWLWSMLAGVFDAVGILLLYMSMTSGRLSLAAPVSALTSAALPVAYGMVTLGIPDLSVLAGLILALASVWLVSRGEEMGQHGRIRFSDLYLPLLSGSCLGAFLVLMHTSSHTAMFWPMIAVRCGGVITLLCLCAAFKFRSHSSAAFPWRLIVLSSLLDVGGNFFYILAGQRGRMDVAAVLSSLFPGTTVFLAWLILKEHISRLQLAGILLALGAIVLFAL